MSTDTSRRRLLVAGLVAGLAIGAAAGAASLTGASSEGPPTPPPVILHVARVLADQGADLELSAGLACPGIESGSCEALSAVVHVLSGGTAGWADVEGVADGTGFRFVIPGSAVPEDGFSYWMEFAIEGGGDVQFPEGGAASAFRVVTTAGLRAVAWPGAFDLEVTRSSNGVVAQLPYGDGAGQVGRVGGVGDEQPLGPSSYDVAPDGSIRVADWVAPARARALAARRGSPLGAVAGDAAGRPRRGSGGRALGHDARSGRHSVRARSRRARDRAVQGGDGCRGADRRHAGRPARVGRAGAVGAGALESRCGPSCGSAVTRARGGSSGSRRLGGALAGPAGRPGRLRLGEAGRIEGRRGAPAPGRVPKRASTTSSAGCRTAGPSRPAASGPRRVKRWRCSGSPPAARSCRRS